jgi:hypothetical protein
MRPWKKFIGKLKNFLKQIKMKIHMGYNKSSMGREVYSAYMEKKEKLQINNLPIKLQESEKQEQVKLQISRRK